MPCPTVCAVSRFVDGSHPLTRKVAPRLCEILLLQPEETTDQVGYAICQLARRRGHRSIGRLQPRDHCGEPVHLIGPRLAQLTAKRIAGVFGPGKPYFAHLQLPVLAGLVLPAEQLWWPSESGNMVVMFMSHG